MMHQKDFSINFVFARARRKRMACIFHMRQNSIALMNAMHIMMTVSVVARCHRNCTAASAVEAIIRLYSTYNDNIEYCICMASRCVRGCRFRRGWNSILYTHINTHVNAHKHIHGQNSILLFHFVFRVFRMPDRANGTVDDFFYSSVIGLMPNCIQWNYTYII